MKSSLIIFAVPIVLWLISAVPGTLHALPTPPTVSSADPEELRPNPGPEQLPPKRSVKQPAALLLGGVLVLLIGTIVWSWFRRPKQSATPAPHEWAIAALAEIEKHLSLETDTLEQCLAEVSNVLRGYLSNRFQLEASQRTTTELLRSLHESNHLTIEQKSRVGEWLARADLVKFARSRTSRQELLHLLSAAKEFVKET